MLVYVEYRGICFYMQAPDPTVVVPHPAPKGNLGRSSSSLLAMPAPDDAIRG